MTRESCPRLCQNCPALPEGVTAELTSLRQPGEDFMRQVKYGGLAHGTKADRMLASMLVATFTVIESTNPAVDAEDEAQLLLTQRDIRHDDVREGIELCSGPSQLTKMQRVPGKQPECQGLPQYDALG